MKRLKLLSLIAVLSGTMSIISAPVLAQNMSKGADNFYKSEVVTMEKVTFKNQYKMNVVGEGEEGRCLLILFIYHFFFRPFY